MQKVRIRDILKIFFKHILPHKWMLFFILIGIVIAETITIFIPIFYKKFFDNLVYGANATQEYTSVLIGILVIILGLHFGSWIFFRISIFMHNWLQPTIMANLERTGFEYLLGHSSSFFANNFTGSLVRKVRRLSHAFEEFSDNLQWELLPLAITITGTMIVISFRSMSIVYLTLAWLLCSS